MTILTTFIPMFTGSPSSAASRSRLHSSTSVPHQINHHPSNQHHRRTSSDVSSPPGSPQIASTAHRHPSAFKPPARSLSHHAQHQNHQESTSTFNHQSIRNHQDSTTYNHQPSIGSQPTSAQLDATQSLLEQLQLSAAQSAAVSSQQNGLLSERDHQGPSSLGGAHHLGTPLSIEELLRSQQTEINQLQTSLAQGNTILLFIFE